MSRKSFEDIFKLIFSAIGTIVVLAGLIFSTGIWKGNTTKTLEVNSTELKSINGRIEILNKEKVSKDIYETDRQNMCESLSEIKSDVKMLVRMHMKGKIE